MQQEESVQTLVDLGLTVLQAKVYIALAKSGTATGRTTAKTAKVAPQDVYRVLSELQEKNLVEKVISKPNKYIPIQIEEGLEILLQRRKKQTTEIENNMSELIKNFPDINDCEIDNEKCQLILVPQNEISDKKLRNVFETADTCVDLTSEFKFSMDEAGRSLDVILKGFKRSIKFRELIDVAPGRCQESRAFSILKKNPAYQTRFFCSTFPVRMAIKDRQEVLISLNNAKSYLDTPCLWSSNPCLVQVIQQWYDTIWEKGITETQRLQ